MSQGFVIWLTGLPGSGKTTIAQLLAEELRRFGCAVEILDSDEVRRKIYSDLGFSREDRGENLKRLTFIANLLIRNGVVVIVAAVSPYRAERAEVRAELQPFVEVYLKCPLEVCIQRHAKLYKEAQAGQILHMTGISDPYEEPENPEIVLETDQSTAEEAIQRILLTLEQSNYLKPDQAFSESDEEKVRQRLEALGYL